LHLLLVGLLQAWWLPQGAQQKLLLLLAVMMLS
jgi:hypothetical protein